MIILTAFGLGVVLVALRSTFSYVVTGGLIVAVFAVAATFSAGAIHWSALFAALLAYNAGIAAVVFIALAFAQRQRWTDVISKHR